MRTVRAVVPGLMQSVIGRQWRGPAALMSASAHKIQDPKLGTTKGRQYPKKIHRDFRHIL